MEQTKENTTEESVVAKIFNEVCEPFINLIDAPRALWGVNLAYFLEGLAYFGILGYLAMFFNEFIGLSETEASPMLGFLTGGITLSMFFFGSLTDRFGVRRTMLVSLALLFIGRAILAFSGYMGSIFGADFLGLWQSAHWTSIGGIIFVILGYGMFMPASYAAVKEFTSEKNAAMGYAMLYALSNLGGWLPTFFPPLRKVIGMNGVIAFLAGVTLLAFFLTSFILSPKTVKEAKAQAEKEREAEKAATAKDGTAGQEENKEEEVSAKIDWNAEYVTIFSHNVSIRFLPLRIRMLIIWFVNHPLADWRFSFFIFCLIPVQTLFAHNWLTLPQYVERAFHGGVVGENFEVAVNFNPLLIFILVPIIAALTQKANVYRIMVIGTAVMAAPTFILALGPTVPHLVLYLVLMTIGEALWQPRFLQLAAEMAPKGRTGAYMGVAQLPWFLTKIITALYAGYFLKEYCPKEGELHTETMWLIYGFIAISSTVMLILAKPFLAKKLAKKAAN